MRQEPTIRTPLYWYTLLLSKRPRCRFLTLFHRSIRRSSYPLFSYRNPKGRRYFVPVSLPTTRLGYDKLFVPHSAHLPVSASSAEDLFYPLLSDCPAIRTAEHLRLAVQKLLRLK